MGNRLFVLLGVVGPALWPPPAQAAAPANERDAILRICAEGPAAALARAERARGEAEVTAASVIPNPALVGEHQRSLQGPREQETVLGVTIPLGIGGRRFVLQDAAANRRERARADADATLFESAMAFREAYARAVVEHARVAVLVDRQAGLESLTSAIQGLAKGGEAAGYDLLRQQALARRHTSSLEVARSRALAARALLEAWTDLDVPVSSAALPTAGVVPSHVGADGGADPKSARVRSLEAAAKASALEARAAERRWVPDVEVFAGYRRIAVESATGHGLSLGLTVPLTFFDHGQGEAARAEAEQGVALALAARLGRERRAEARAARTRLEGLGRALVDADEAVVETRAIHAKAQQLYSAGEATITELLETFVAAEEAQLARLDLIEEIAGARLSLMRAAGTMFDQSLDRVCRSGGGAG